MPVLENNSEKVNNKVVIQSKLNDCPKRNKDETPEERKLRKSKVKSERKIRRENKKATKLAFKEEEMIVKNENVKDTVKGRSIFTY